MKRTSAYTAYLPDKRFLLQLRDSNAPTNPNHRGFFGGGLELGETYWQALIRELHEELQINVIDAKSVGRFYLTSIDTETELFIEPLHYPIHQLLRDLKEGASLGMFFFPQVLHMKISSTDFALAGHVNDWLHSNL
jgi:8-oxo-dGTP pyrophosphatase MutT (NUDIX family)